MRSCRLDRRLVVGLTLLATDIAGLLLAHLGASLVPFTFSRYMVNRDWLELFDDYSPIRLLQVLGFAIALILWLTRRGHYTRRPPSWIATRQLAMGCLFAMLCDGFLQFGVKHQFSRLWLVEGWLLAIPLLVLLRLGARWALKTAGLWAVPVLVAGSAERAGDTAAVLEREMGYRVVGFVALDGLPGRTWRDVCAAAGAELVALAAAEVELMAHRQVMTRLAMEGIAFVCVQSLAGLPVLSLRVHPLIGSDAVLLMAEERLDRLGRLIKAAFDRVIAGCGLVLLMPLLALVAPLIIRDGGPLFFRHRRVGLAGAPFHCLKLRTMAVDAEDRLAEVLAGDPAAGEEWRRRRKLSDDPRVTAVGGFLRRHGLDELPQLINVLRGEMSLVGPRPIDFDEAERFGGQLGDYYRTLPGMTGLWQISQGAELDYPRRVELNSWYVRNWSIWLDLVILVRTVPVLLRGRR